MLVSGDVKNLLAEYNGLRTFLLSICIDEEMAAIPQYKEYNPEAI